MLKAVMCSERLPAEAIDKLKRIAKRVFLLPSDKMLDEAVCHHPDMILTQIGDKMICHKDYFEENKQFLSSMCDFSGLTPVLSETDRGSKYPKDIAFNVLITDRYLYCNEKHTAKEILYCGAEYGLQIINTAQGYAACSCLLIENTIITSDVSIVNAAKGNNNVIQTEGGGIVLEPYDTGFIGGAAGYLDGVLYTFGNLEYYNGAEAVLHFLRDNNITVCPLHDGKLTDYGGIKFIK